MTLGNYRFQKGTANGDNNGLGVPRHCYLIVTEIQSSFAWFNKMLSNILKCSQAIARDHSFLNLNSELAVAKFVERIAPTTI